MEVPANQSHPPWAWVIGAIAVLACAIRLFRLDHFSYWLDEILQTYIIQGRFKDVLQAARADAVHPPLDYLIGHLVEICHPADWVRKLPAVAWGVLTVVAVAFLLRRRVSAAAGAVAALLLASSTFHVHYSQELRPYSLGLFCICLTLILLDRHLETRSAWSLLALYVAALATAYTLYLAALVAGVAALGLLLDDAASGEPERAKGARRFLLFSPLLLLALWIGYLPWWPVLLDALRRPPTGPAPSFEFSRLTRLFSFFSFGVHDWDPMTVMGWLFAGLVLVGLFLAVKTSGTRFLAAWLLLGLGGTEWLEEARPHYDGIQHFVPGGLVLPLLAAIPIAALLQRRRWRPPGFALLALILIADVGALRRYFRDGRPDWRPMARYLQATPRSQRIFVENQYTQLCLGYYIDGPSWLPNAMGHKPAGREILNLEGRVRPLSWSWKPGTDAWLVLAGGPESPELRKWAKPFPGQPFPKAEGKGGGGVKHLLGSSRPSGW